MHSIKIYTLIMRSFDWEGLREELHQHFQECMSYVELGQPMDSMQESFQPFLPSFGRGGMPMHNSMCMRNYDGKGSDHENQVSFSNLSHSFIIFLQAMTAKGSEISCRSHGFWWANRNSELGHSLVVQRENPFHDGCFPKAPNIFGIFSHVKVTHAANVWWDYHLPHLDPMKAGDALRWHHM